MKELPEGVFFSRWDADEWRPEEQTGGLIHILREDASLEAGLWKPGPVAGHEFSFDLEGAIPSLSGVK
jgi:hypothetical protein